MHCVIWHFDTLCLKLIHWILNLKIIKIQSENKTLKAKNKVNQSFVKVKLFNDRNVFIWHDIFFFVLFLKTCRSNKSINVESNLSWPQNLTFCSLLSFVYVNVIDNDMDTDIDDMILVRLQNKHTNMCIFLSFSYKVATINILNKNAVRTN